MDRDKIMSEWDYWRKEIFYGNTSSAPRDWFESILDYYDEKLEDERNRTVTIKTSELPRWKPNAIIGRRREEE